MIKKTDTIKKVREKVKKIIFYEYISTAVTNIASFTLITYFLFLVAFVAFFTSYFALNGGNKAAEKQIYEYKSCSEMEKNYSCVYLYSGNILEESGLLIDRSQTHIAIYNGKESRVLPLKDREVRTNVKPPQNANADPKK